MSWITIPNERILSFTGKPEKAQKLNDDLEYVYKPFRCSYVDGDNRCEYRATLLREWREHIEAEHPDSMDSLGVNLEAEMVETNVAWLILRLLLDFNREGTRENPNLLSKVRRGNDSRHAEELWRRAWNCRDRNEVKVKKETYDWLHQLLDRKLPLDVDPQRAKLLREEGEEQQTVGGKVFGLSEEAVRRTLTTLPDRKPVDDEEEAEAVYLGQEEVIGEEQ